MKTLIHKIFTSTFPLLRGACFVIAVCLLWAACSTTSNLPEGEQLYIGIKDITYNDEPKKEKQTALPDSAGVITSIAGAVDAVENVFAGSTAAAWGYLSKAIPKAELTKEQKDSIKARREADSEAFEPVQEEVEAVLAYPPNNAIFGSSSLRSPLQIGLWIHNGLADAKGAVGKWVYRNFATTPVLVSTVSPEMRAKVATNTLHNYGYFNGKVSHEVLTQKNPRKAKLNYHVRAGHLYRLDSVDYRNFMPMADSLLRATKRQRLLHRGDPFSVVNLADEQTRIENLFRENGYYFYSASNTAYLADTLMRPGYVQLRVQPSADLSERARHPWFMGNVYISVRNKEADVLDKTVGRRGYYYQYSGEKLPLRPIMWRQAVSHRKGEPFRLTDQKHTIEKLNTLGVFSQLDVNYVPRDTLPSCDTLDVYITALMDKLYDSAFEMNATMKSNQQVGPGVSYELAKRNAFRGGEKVSFKIFGSYEWQTGAGAKGGNSLLNSFELGTQLALEFPRFVFPGISQRRTRFPASTVFAVSADWKNRSGFFNMMNLGLSATYKWHKRPTSKHELTLFSLDFDKTFHTTHSFDSIMTENPALAVSMRDQFIPSISYTYTFASAAHHRNPTRLQVHVKEAGNVVSGIYAAAGKPFSQLDKQLFGNPFAQFVKATAELSQTFRMNRRINLATRIFGGVVYSYGNSLHAPYSEQFYVGGANSVRAFTVRSVGPGSFRASNSKYAYMDQTGDVKLEANVELRAQLFGSLHGAVFLDAGNVWLLRDDPARPGGKFSAENLRNIAFGTGVGLRYDLEFLVLRLDMGVALHAPYTTSKSGFYNIPRFKDGLAFHFAIGYPF